MTVLYPADPLFPNRIDDSFKLERAAFEAAGIHTSVKPVPGEIALYRGWMLKVDEYGALEASVKKQGAALLTSTDAYKSAHYLPEWYEKLQDLTAETVIETPENAQAKVAELGWPRTFVKDYVKSLKTPPGSVVVKPEDIADVLEAMRHYRGFIEGGVCLRRFEPYLPGSERRYFVVRGQGYAAEGDNLPDIVTTCAERLDSPFFSVDVAQLDSGALRVVEVGDGGVSDLVGWTPKHFVSLW
ncbi:ATP-grasp domain-containing protein [soil metagenome]